MKIAFYVNDSKPGAKDAAAALAVRAAALGLEVTDLDALRPAAGASSLIVALGGDGTILRSVHEHPLVPVIGFNLGGLGYLASVEKKDFATALAMLAAGRYRVAERSMLAAGGAVALNDIVVTREMTGHAASLDLAVDGRPATRYLADGLVIATPTGSTAYSLSAGGPVLMPDSCSFVVTPMNPHALGIRPLVVSDAVRLTVTSRSRSHGTVERLGVYADGEPVTSLGPGETLEIVRASRPALLVELEGYDPSAVLARKLGWSGTMV